jgi:hypothetical protein
MTAAASVLTFRPRLGQWWRAAGGFLAGTLGEQTLICAAVWPWPLIWDDADAWAKSFRLLDFQDYSLPTRTEAKLLLQILPSRFEFGQRVWTSEHGHSGDAMTFARPFDFAPRARLDPLHAVAVRRQPTN